MALATATPSPCRSSCPAGGCRARGRTSCRWSCGVAKRSHACRSLRRPGQCRGHLSGRCPGIATSRGQRSGRCNTTRAGVPPTGGARTLAACPLIGGRPGIGLRRLSFRVGPCDQGTGSVADPPLRRLSQNSLVCRAFSAFLDLLVRGMCRVGDVSKCFHYHFDCMSMCGGHPAFPPPVFQPL